MEVHVTTACTMKWQLTTTNSLYTSNPNVHGCHIKSGK